MSAGQFDDIKSMPVFFLDNKHMWSSEAILLKNLVLWPDGGKYPTFKPVSIARHPQFDGMITVLAGNRRIVVTFLPGVESQAEIPKAMNLHPEQYCIAIEAIVHAIMVHKAEADGVIGGSGDINALTVLNAIKGMPEAQLLRDALTCSLHKGELSPENYTATEELLQSLSHEVDA